MYLVGTWPHMLYVVVCWLSTLSKRKNIRILVGCWSCDRFGRELVAGFAYGEIGRTLDKNSADQHRDQLSECGAVIFLPDIVYYKMDFTSMYPPEIPFVKMCKRI